MYVVKKMICRASVCNGALVGGALRTVGTVCGSFALPRLEHVFTTAFFISQRSILLVRVVAPFTCRTVVFQVETYAMCITVCARFAVAIPLWNMFFNLVTSDLAFVGHGKFLAFSIARIFVRRVLHCLFDHSLDRLGGEGLVRFLLDLFVGGRARIVM